MPPMNTLEAIHERHVKSRRVGVLADMLEKLLPDEGRVLDIGSGDGAMAAELMRRKPGLKIEGIDTLVRPQTAIPTRAFDGVHIDSPDGTYDCCVFVDVLHHADQPEELLAEAVRVNRGTVVIKDHLRDGILAQQTLTFMDRVHNARYGVSLPCRYWSTQEWEKIISSMGLEIETWEDKLALYPNWANWMFGRGLHVITRLRHL